MTCNKTTDDTRELFKRLLSESLDEKFRELDEEMKNVELPPPSRRHKVEMNRLFREHVGGSFIPFPDADNLDNNL